MNALIFAAGLGTRLRPLTNDRPKAMVKVAGRTLLEHNIVKLRDAGFDHIVVNVHHFGDKIISFLRDNGNFGIDIRVSDERDLLLDTGGGLRRAMPMFDNDDPVLVHNVDIVCDADLRSLYEAHCRNEREAAERGEVLGATLVVNERQTSRYLLFDDDMRMRGWTNVQTGEVKGTKATHQLAFSGIHIVSHALVPFLNDYGDGSFPVMSFYLNVCDRIVLRGENLPADCRWVDCGKVESLAKASEILLYNI